MPLDTSPVTIRQVFSQMFYLLLLLEGETRAPFLPTEQPAPCLQTSTSRSRSAALSLFPFRRLFIDIAAIGGGGGGRGGPFCVTSET